VKRIYAIWPADRQGLPATSSAACLSTRWLVLDVTDGLGSAHVVIDSPLSRGDALRRQLELRAVDRALIKARRKEAA